MAPNPGPPGNSFSNSHSRARGVKVFLLPLRSECEQPDIGHTFERARCESIAVLRGRGFSPPACAFTPFIHFKVVKISLTFIGEGFQSLGCVPSQSSQTSLAV